MRGRIEHLVRIICIMSVLIIAGSSLRVAFAEEPAICWVKATNIEAQLRLNCSYTKLYQVEWYGGTAFDNERNSNVANGQGYILFRQANTGYQSGRISSSFRSGYLENNIVVNDLFKCSDDECSEVELTMAAVSQSYKGIVAFDQSGSKIESLTDGLLLDYGHSLYYNGMFDNNMAHGYGNVCFGQLPQGNSLALLSNRNECPFPMSYQDGEWSRGQFVKGEGRILFQDGGMYEGGFAAGTLNGWGRYLWSDQSTFYGEFLDGQRTGYGTYKYADGSIYEGDWENNKKHGHGTLIIAEKGIEYQGEFQSGNIHGQGIMRFQDKFTYVGRFENNKPQSDNKNADIIIDEKGNVFSVKFDNGVLIDIDPQGDDSSLQEIRAFLQPPSFKQVAQSLSKNNVAKGGIFASVDTWIEKNKDHIVNTAKGCIAGAAGGAIAGGTGGAIVGTVVSGVGTAAVAVAGATTGALNGCINQAMGAFAISTANNGVYTKEQMIAAMQTEISTENFIAGALAAAGLGLSKKLLDTANITNQVATDIAKGASMENVVLNVLMSAGVGGRVLKKLKIAEAISKSKIVTKVYNSKAMKVIDKNIARNSTQIRKLELANANMKNASIKKAKNKLAGKKDFEGDFVKNAQGPGKDLYSEKVVRGGGVKGTRRPDIIKADDKKRTITRTETKSQREARNPTSWCGTYPTDYLSKCREKIKSQYGGCNAQSAWMITIACQANCYRQSTFKDQKLNYKYRNFKKNTGLLAPKEHSDAILASLKQQGISVGQFQSKPYGDAVLFEFSEKTMDALTSKFGIAADLAGKCTSQ